MEAHDEAPIAVEPSNLDPLESESLVERNRRASDTQRRVSSVAATFVGNSGVGACCPFDLVGQCIESSRVSCVLIGLSR